MAQLGADVEQLDSLAQRMKQAASEIQQLSSQITSQVNQAWWQGTDANNFRSQWDGTFRSQLQNMCNAFEETGTQVKSQADQQRQASA